MKFNFAILLALLFIHPSFANEPPKGSINGYKYTYNEIGWSFDIPDGWSVRSAEEIARVRGIAKEAFLETLNQDVPLTPTPLLYLHNGKNNRFTSEAGVYDQSPDIYEANADQLNAQLQELFNSKGLKTSGNKSKIKINGINFLVYGTNILSQDRKKVLAKSIMYTALIDNIDFVMSYTCVDRKECKKIESAILSSSFSK
jgi:hypothetical protein